MDDWVFSNNRKVHQRKLNKIVRDINKTIEEDELWNGRFFIRQISSEFERFEDKSGGELFVVLRFYDKKDMKFQDFFGDSSSLCHLSGARLWLTMNDFITKISSTWKSDVDPREIDPSVYELISREETIKNAEPYSDRMLATRW